ncbi:MAG TPA: hypothetical protein VF215_09040 [Thermoanaerobaculia bacterium]
MKRNYRRLSASALTLVFCLAVAPLATAKPTRDRERFDPADPIVRIIKKVKNFIGRITALDDFPGPPVP